MIPGILLAAVAIFSLAIIAWRQSQALEGARLEQEDLQKRLQDFVGKALPLEGQLEQAEKELQQARRERELQAREYEREIEANAEHRRIIRQLRSAGPFLERAVTSARRPEWKQEDAESFRAWLASALGRKFAGILQFDEQHQNRSAVCRVSDHAYNSGFAAGFGARSQSIEELSADVRPQQDEASAEGDGVATAAERLTP